MDSGAWEIAGADFITATRPELQYNITFLSALHMTVGIEIFCPLPVVWCSQREDGVALQCIETPTRLELREQT